MLKFGKKNVNYFVKNVLRIFCVDLELFNSEEHTSRTCIGRRNDISVASLVPVPEVRRNHKIFYSFKELVKVKSWTL